MGHDVDDAEWAEFKVVKNGHLKRIKQQLGVRVSVEAVSSDERVSRHSGTDISEARDKLRQFVEICPRIRTCTRVVVLLVGLSSHGLAVVEVSSAAWRNGGHQRARPTGKDGRRR